MKSGRFWLGLALLCVINAAGWVWFRASRSAPAIREPGLLRVERVLPDVDPRDVREIKVVFTEPVAPQPLPTAELSEPPFSVTPAPAAASKWRWADDRTLVLDLDEALAPGITYVVKPLSGLRASTGRVLVGPDEFRIMTDRVRPVSAEVTSVSESAAHVRVRFNQKVRPDDVRKHIRAESANGSALSMAVYLGEPKDEVLVKISGVPAGKVRVTVTRGLRPAEGDLRLEEDVQLEPIQIERTFALRSAAPRVGSIRWGDQDPSITLQFTEELKPDQPLPSVRVTPALDAQRIDMDKSTLEVRGAFQLGRKYSVEVGPELLSKSGKPLGRPQSRIVVMPDRQPEIALAQDFGYLSPRGLLQLDLRTANVDHVTVAARRLFDNCLVTWANQQRDSWGGWSETSRRVADREFDLESVRNRVTAASVQIGGIVPDMQPGVYRLQVRSPRVSSDSAVVVLSDLGLTAFQSDTRILAWVTRMSDGRTVPGADVRLWSDRNQEMSAGTTDRDGLVELPSRASGAVGYAAVVTAELAGDRVFLNLRRANSPYDEEADDAAPEIFSGDTPYDAFVYSERGIYRPGEVVHATCLLREKTGGTPEPFPFVLRLVRPDGVGAGEVLVSAESGMDGMFHADLPIPVGSRTGEYRLEATLPGKNGLLLGDMRPNLWVEDFVPSRMRVNASFEKPRYVPAEAPRVRAEAAYLFGAPAAGLRATCDTRFVALNYQSKAHPGFSFGVRERKEVLVKSEPDVTDEEGRVAFPVELPEGHAPRLWEMRSTVTVSEIGGRSQKVTCKSVFDGTRRHVGLRIESGNQLARTPLDVEWVQVAENDEPADPGPMLVVLSRVEYRTQRVRVTNGKSGRSGERWVYRTREEEIVESSQRIDPDSPAGRFRLKTMQSGTYRVTFTDQRSGEASQLDFVAVDPGSVDAFRARTPESLELRLDKKRYEPGQTAHVALKSPFEGRLLLSLSGEEVVWKSCLELPAASSILDVPVPVDLRGGARLEARVIRAFDVHRTRLDPLRASGVVTLETDHPAQRLLVDVAVPPSGRPGETMHIDVSARDASGAALSEGVAHVWAVDEGILMATAFPTPDPYKALLGPRHSGVTVSDTYENEFGEYTRPETYLKIGAGGDDEFVKASLSVIPPQKRASVVLWNRVARLDAAGHCILDVPAPDYAGELRVMAVVASKDRYGSAGAALKVVPPVHLEVSAPRFLVPGDHARIPVRVFNNTAEAVGLDVTATAESALAGGWSGRVEVSPRASVVEWIPADGVSLGRGILRVRASGAGVPSGKEPHAEIEIPVRPASSPVTLVRAVPLDAKGTAEIPREPGMIPQFTKETLAVGPRRLVELAPLVDRLLTGLPPTVSDAALQVRALVQAVSILGSDDPARADLARERVRYLVDWLSSAQGTNGAMPSHHDGADESIEGTVETALALGAARRAGLVNAERFSMKLQEFVRDAQKRHDLPAVSSDPDDEETFVLTPSAIQRLGGPAPLIDDAGERSEEQNVNNSRAMLMAAGAALDQRAENWLRTLRERAADLDPVPRAYLAFAVRESSDEKSALRVLMSGTPPDGQTSRLENVCAYLWCIGQIDPEHPLASELSEALYGRMRRGECGGARAAALAVLGLDSIVRRAATTGAYTGELVLPGAVHRFDSVKPLELVLGVNDWPARVRVEGAGRPVLVLTTHGLPSQDSAESRDTGLAVRRKWTMRNGEDLPEQGPRVGDLIAVRLTLMGLDAAEAGSVRVGLVDLLPAGFEFEGASVAPRYSVEHLIDPELDEASPSRVEMLDDRAVFVITGKEKPQQLVYFVRATTVGDFAWPPVQATNLASPSRVSLSGKGRITVRP